MVVRVYWSLWALTAISVPVLFVAGGLNMMAAVVYGLIAFGLIFMGMIGVLPNMAAHPAEHKPASPKPAAQPARSESAETLGVLKSA